MPTPMHHYRTEVFWSEEDSGYIARLSEDVSHDAEKGSDGSTMTLLPAQ